MVGSIDAALRNQVTVTAHKLRQVQKRDWAVTVTFATNYLGTTRIKRLYKRRIKRLSNARSAKLGTEGQRVTIGTKGRLS